ncbi:MAG: hypothetical protein H7228_01675 [Polaromonas sp.]|nr:hypothetical protein [Polaromonas sp.]
MRFFWPQPQLQALKTYPIPAIQRQTRALPVSLMIGLVLAFVFTLSACGGGGGGGSSAAGNPSAVIINTQTPTASLSSASGLITNNAQLATFSPMGSTERIAQAFTTVVGQGVEVYTFQNSIQAPDGNGNSAGLAIQVFRFSSVDGKIADASYTEITFENSVPKRLVRTCGDPCTGLSASKTASGSGITITLQNVKLVGDAANSSVANPPTAAAIFNGSVTGEIPGGYIFASQLPHSTVGDLSLNGSNQAITYSDVYYSFVEEPQPELFPTINMVLASGTLRVVREPGVDGSTAAYTVSYESNAQVLYSTAATANVLETTASGYLVKLNNLVLKKNGTGPEAVTVSNTIAVGRPTGALSTPGESDFKPLFGGVGASDDLLRFDFTSAVPKGVFVQPGVQIDIRNGEVVSFSAASNSGNTYACDGKVSNQTTARCSGSVTLSADKRSLTFTNFKASAKLRPPEVITFNGVLTATGL